MREYVVSGIGTIALALAAGLAIANVLRRSSERSLPSLIAAVVAVVINVIALATSISHDGTVDTLRQSYESGLVLATLLGLMGLFGRQVPAMQGLDGILFVLAAVVEFGTFFQIGRPGINVTYKSWFVTHQFAFAISATCFAASGAAGGAYLMLYRLLRRKRGLAWLGRFAPLESLEQFGRRTLMIGFPCLTYGVLTGFCQLSRQRNPADWLMDPFILTTLTLWAVYAAAVLLIWLRPSMRGPRAATLATASLGLLIVVFVILDRVSTLHR
jgi:ABC-type uncharacterized transport system permease subunit